ncbi:MAG: bifunctional phosphopantothenoylcysteine decarboxylase/phosphopantothenate--cysteine ligase CoaBC [Lentisphaerae bacterium]|jgi:phosphopantothenoylcysteine decarboxylase / phosphopantothenate---cysteine ligase|nr:bifunctional phosphopantothenoylcysteine decarboxylase/phosphopantothenate--cysteine ligase CoaBC [Lentisphaerota bacterium]MBT4814602.1 bifunctional phosphopantothenoylcysteine decarboxylase/phosphopantothenate--cysteine ligase CoaBC [Lentisphaerota bacterium]MBT5610131.1 bifunctional phosphopantothenoylcysteine decarboxylase/phosphopantothenate--cysteine ligase CoaBC [Lentisphaerota bacterium]MBT7053577.1 bifunctional phosphopantothenoylcysteine decarboxylase/phosphopantothenate--cysteine l
MSVEDALPAGGGSTVVLGVTGSIAAYKAAELTSALVRAGIDVHVLMTRSATALVQARTFLTLSRNPVTSDLWGVPTWQPEHIALSERAHVLVVAPATANFIGKLAHGIADDALSTYALSHVGTTIIAPAMNPRMWQHPAVQANCELLRQRGVAFVGPDSGRVACGSNGRGRLAAVSSIEQAVHSHLAVSHGRQNGALDQEQHAPLRILVSAGPTCEDLDPVRYLTNRSTGKMGYAIASTAVAAGHDVVLVSGPTQLAPVAGCRCLDVVSAAEVGEVVGREFDTCDVLVMCAAVADFRPSTAADQKLKKQDGGMVLELARTEDVLGSLAPRKRPDQRIMGFAAETNGIVANAEAKLAAKSLDWIVANDVSRADVGFASDANEVSVVTEGGVSHLPKMQKTDVAVRLLGLIERSFA